MDVIVTIVGTGGGGGDSELVVSHMDSSLDIYFAWVDAGGQSPVGAPGEVEHVDSS